MGLGGVILAAGESTRMGRDKALLPWPPDPAGTLERVGNSPSGTLLSAAIEALGRYCDMVFVVAGKNETALRLVAYGCGAFLARNPTPERGQFSSLQIGLQEVMSRGRDAAMITLVDRPPPKAATLAKLLDAFEKLNRNSWALVPQFEGKHGHPILVGREMIEVFLRSPATATAREIEHANQQRITYVPVDDSRVTVNINSPEDYARLASSFEI
jgi:molybdenum cofactor cytidylyltransferase